VVKFLGKCVNLIINNNFILIIQNEDEKYWRISHPTEDDLWNCIVGGKIIIEAEQKIKIFCTEADTKFRISRVSGIDT
jgi:hypothetical protein